MTDQERNIRKVPYLFSLENLQFVERCWQSSFPWCYEFWVQFTSSEIFYNQRVFRNKKKTSSFAYFTANVNILSMPEIHDGEEMLTTDKKKQYSNEYALSVRALACREKILVSAETNYAVQVFLLAWITTFYAPFRRTLGCGKLPWCCEFDVEFESNSLFFSLFLILMMKKVPKHRQKNYRTIFTHACSTSSSWGKSSHIRGNKLRGPSNFAGRKQIRQIAKAQIGWCFLHSKGSHGILRVLRRNESIEFDVSWSITAEFHQLNIFENFASCEELLLFIIFMPFFSNFWDENFA